MRPAGKLDFRQGSLELYAYPHGLCDVAEEKTRSGLDAPDERTRFGRQVDTSNAGCRVFTLAIKNDIFIHF